MRQQLSNPGGITLIGLCARSLPDILAMGYTHRDRFTQDMLDRLPVDARTLQGLHRTLLRMQPGAQSDQGTLGGTTVDQL